MAEIDKQKEKIAFLRSIFILLLGSLFALIGFIVTKYPLLNQIQLILADIGGFILLTVIIFLLIKILKEIDKLKDL